MAESPPSESRSLPPFEAGVGALAGVALWAGGSALQLTLDPRVRSLATLAEQPMFWVLAMSAFLVGGLGWIVGDRRRELENSFHLFERAVDEQLAAIGEREWVTRAVVQNAFDAVLILNLEGAVLDANPMAARIFGHTLDALVSLRIDELLPDHERLETAAVVERRTAGGERLGVEWRTRARHVDGSLFPVDLHISILSDPGLLVYAVRDSSSRLMREEALVRKALDAQKDRAVLEQRTRGTVLRDLSGGLRDEIERVLASVELLDPDDTDGPRDQIIDASHVILERLDDLWNVMMWERANAHATSTSVSVSALLDEVTRSSRHVATRNRNRLVTRIATDVELVVTDPNQLGCAIRNLVLDALRRARDGQVTLDAVREPGRGTDWLAVFVQDDGPLLPPEVLDGLVLAMAGGEPASVPVGQRSGLALALRLARALGGHLSAESQPGVGTSFCLRLPFEPGRVKDVPLRPVGPMESPPPVS